MTATTKIKPASNSRRRYAKTQSVADAIVRVLDTYPNLKMSTRQVFYQCVSNGAVKNCDAGYDKVQRLLVQLRRDGVVGYDRIVDRTRRSHQRASWAGAEEIISACSAQFRRDIWATQDTIVMIALEKQALEGIFASAVDKYGASLWVIRGFNSESFAYEWATEIIEYTDEGKDVVVYWYGDHDPSGMALERDAIDKLHMHGAEFEWRRSGLLFSDLHEFDLINVPVKSGDTRTRKYVEQFGNRAAELDALPPDELMFRIGLDIDRHVDDDELERVRRNEELERESLRLVAENWKKAVAAVGGGE